MTVDRQYQMKTEAIIKNLGSSVARIIFVKKNNELRTMVGTRDPLLIEYFSNLSAALSGSKSNILTNMSKIQDNNSVSREISGGYVTVFDLEKLQFRTFNPSRLVGEPEVITVENTTLYKNFTTTPSLTKGWISYLGKESIFTPEVMLGHLYTLLLLKNYSTDSGKVTEGTKLQELMFKSFNLSDLVLSKSAYVAIDPRSSEDYLIVHPNFIYDVLNKCFYYAKGVKEGKTVLGLPVTTAYRCTPDLAKQVEKYLKFNKGKHTIRKEVEFSPRMLRTLTYLADRFRAERIYLTKDNSYVSFLGIQGAIVEQQGVGKVFVMSSRVNLVLRITGTTVTINYLQTQKTYRYSSKDSLGAVVAEAISNFKGVETYPEDVEVALGVYAQLIKSINNGIVKEDLTDRQKVVVTALGKYVYNSTNNKDALATHPISDFQEYSRSLPSLIERGYIRKVRPTQRGGEERIALTFKGYKQYLAIKDTEV